MFIHHFNCISPQQTFGQVDVETLHGSQDNKLKVIEPTYEGIPPGILRRMGKAVRMGVGSALPVLQAAGETDGIIIGTANGGMEDCIRFLNQITDYEEGMLTPGNFVQSTPNAIAAQLGLMTRNKKYNITHVHRGLAFENAMLDAILMLKDNPGGVYLLGAVDEISAYNYNIDYLDGWYKKEPMQGKSLYSSDTDGSLAGEGAAMFTVNNQPENAIARITGLQTLHTTNPDIVKASLNAFLEKYLKREKPDIFFSGENGDSRLLPYYTAAESVFDAGTTIARFKHMSGEFPTASAIALWLVSQIQNELPAHCVKKAGFTKQVKNIVIYNNYKGIQHSFIYVQKVV